MKAVVMEIKDEKAVILTDDGTFREMETGVLAGACSVGDVFDYDPAAGTAAAENAAAENAAAENAAAENAAAENAAALPAGGAAAQGSMDAERQRRSRRRIITRITAVAACVLLVLSIGLYSYRDLAVYAKVRIGSGPAIEYSLNRKGEVIGVDPVGNTEEAEAAVSELEKSGVKGKSLEEAIDMTEKISEDRFGSDPKVSVECKDKEDRSRFKKKTEKKLRENEQKREEKQKREENPKREEKQKRGSEQKSDVQKAGTKNEAAGEDGAKDSDQNSGEKKPK